MPRTVTITGAPFDVRLSPVSVQHFTENGEATVKDAVADYIVKNGHGTEGKAPGAKARNGKGGARRVRARGAAAAEPVSGKTSTRRSGTGATKEQIAANADIDATAANLQPVDRLDGASVADADSASDRRK